MAASTGKFPAVSFVLMLIFAVSGTAVALNLAGLTAEKLSLFETAPVASDLTIADYATKMKGKNKVDVDLTVANPDAASHAADITVQLLDASGDIIASCTVPTGECTVTQATGSISAGGGSTALTFSFEKTGLVGEYASTLYVIDQTA